MSEELIYLYRRKGQDAWATCDAERYAEVSTNHFFEVRVARDQYDYNALRAELDNCIRSWSIVRAERDQLLMQVRWLREELEELRALLNRG